MQGSCKEVLASTQARKEAGMVERKEVDMLVCKLVGMQVGSMVEDILACTQEGKLEGSIQVGMLAGSLVGNSARKAVRRLAARNIVCY